MAYKKSQTELLGLAIVVVLVIIATIFVARFFISKESPDTRRSYVVSEQASSMIKAILETDSGCMNLKFSELIKKCADSMEIDGCIPIDACEFLDEKLGQVIFLNTFEMWKKNYQFLIYNGKDLKKEIKNLDCLNAIKRGNEIKELQEADYYIPTDSGSVELRLIVC